MVRVDLDAKVRTRDGHDVGSVESAVLDRDRKEVTDFVISTGGLLGRDILIPRRLLEAAREDGDVLTLDLTKDELEKMPSYVRTDYASPPAAWIPPSGFLYPTAGYVWPVAPGVEEPMVAQLETASPEANAELNEAANVAVNVNKGAPVIDSEGDDIGVVDDVRLDPDTGRMTGFVIRTGGLLQTLFGGGDTLELTPDVVEGVDGVGSLRLKVSKENLRQR